MVTLFYAAISQLVEERTGWVYISLSKPARYIFFTY